MTTAPAILIAVVILAVMAVVYLKAKYSSQQARLNIADGGVNQNACRWLFSCAINTVILSGLVAGLIVWFVFSGLLDWR